MASISATFQHQEYLTPKNLAEDWARYIVLFGQERIQFHPCNVAYYLAQSCYHQKQKVVQ